MVYRAGVACLIVPMHAQPALNFGNWNGKLVLAGCLVGDQTARLLSQAFRQLMWMLDHYYVGVDYLLKSAAEGRAWYGGRLHEC